MTFGFLLQEICYKQTCSFLSKALNTHKYKESIRLLKTFPMLKNLHSRVGPHYKWAQQKPGWLINHISRRTESTYVFVQFADTSRSGQNVQTAFIYPPVPSCYSALGFTIQRGRWGEWVSLNQTEKKYRGHNAHRHIFMYWPCGSCRSKLFSCTSRTNGIKAFL